MNRRRPTTRPLVLALSFAALVALAALGVLLLQRRADSPWRDWSRLSGRAATGPPDVILITIDTLRADRLGCYGSPRASTPQIDALAAEGARFANAATTVPFTLPAHSSLMTGTYPPYHGVRENVGYTLDATLPTLAERLAAGGWSTGGFVSAFVLDSRWGIGRGFSTYFDDFEPPEGGSANLASVQRDGAETVAAAERWLDTGPPRPLFLWLHLFDPHDPYTPPEPYRSRFPGRPYEGEVAYADELVGRLRRALEARGLLETSLLILTGDHGEGLGQHREGFHGFFVYDSTIRVPLILRSPSRRLAGRVVEEPVSHVDLLPTVLELAGQPIPEHVQGRSLVPLLLGRGEESADEWAVYSESMYPLLHYGWAPLRSIRTRSHKFIAAPRAELYDLESDAQERRNVLLENRRTSRSLKERLDALVARIEIGGRSAAPAELDEETLEQLQALGYVAGRGGVSVEEESDTERADPKDRIDLHRLVMAAQSELGKGEREKAAARLEEALAADPSMVDAHQMLGAIASQREELQAAAEHFQAALRVKDDHLASLYGLANAYRRLGREEEALVGFRRLLELQPADTKVVLAVADLLERLDRRPEAMATLEASVARPDPPAILMNRLGELKSLEGDARLAADLFQRAMEANPELVQPRFNLAVLYEEEGRLEEAVTLYEAVLERAPRHFQAQFNLGRLYGLRGDPDAQERIWRAALESNPDFVRGYYFLAKLLMDRGGDLGRAEELVREGLARDPEHRAGPLGYYVLADILNRAGQPAEAARAAENGRRLEGG